MSNRKDHDSLAAGDQPLTEWAQAVLEREIQEDLTYLRNELDVPLTDSLLELKRELLGEDAVVAPAALVSEPLGDEPLTDWAQALLEREQQEDLEVLRAELEVPLSPSLLALKEELLGGAPAPSPLAQLWDQVQTQVATFLNSVAELGSPEKVAGFAAEGMGTAALETSLPYFPLLTDEALAVELLSQGSQVRLHFLGEAVPALGDIEVLSVLGQDFTQVHCDVLHQLEDELLLSLGNERDWEGRELCLGFPLAGSLKRLRVSFSSSSLSLS